jgi:hypothetical protein
MRSTDFEHLHARRSAARQRRHRMHCNGSDDQSLQLIYGIAITLVGIGLTLASFGLTDTGAVLRFWPAAIVVAGGVGVARAKDGPARVWGWFWILLGTWLLARTAGRSHVNFWDLVWPMALVGLGVKLWLDAMRRPGAPLTPKPTLGSTASHLTAILAGSTRVVQEPVFPGASMTTVLGNCTLDLHLSGPPADGEAVVEVFALLGAHEIVVPEGWTVVSEVTSVGASVDDRRSSFAGRTRVPGDTRPRIIVRGMLILSGLTIKH